MSNRGTLLFLVPPEMGHVLPTIAVARDLKTKGFEIVYLTAGFFSSVLAKFGFETIGLLPPAVEEESGMRYGWTYWYVLEAHTGLTSSRLIKSAVQKIVTTRKVYGLIIDSLYLDDYGADLGGFLRSFRHFGFSVSLPNWGAERSAVQLPRAVLCPACFELPHLSTRDPLLFHAAAGSYTPGLEKRASRNSRRRTILAVMGSQSRMHVRQNQRLELLRMLALNHGELSITLACGDLEMNLLNHRGFPTNLKIVSSVPQSELLAETDCFINHGGLGSIKESVLASVPMVILPVLFDQPYNAIRVEAHRLGLSLFEEELTYDRLEAAVLEILESDSIRSHLHQFRQVFSDPTRNRKAADIVMDWL